MKINKYLSMITKASLGLIALGLLGGCVYSPYPSSGYYYTASPRYYSCSSYYPYRSCYYSSQYYYSSYPYYYYNY